MTKIPGLRYDSPKAFGLRQRVALAVFPAAVAFVLKLLVATCRFDVRGREHLDDAIAAHGRVLLAVWHETLALAAVQFRNTGGHTLTSYSFDGEMAARVVGHFGLHALRGSSSRGGSQALRDMAAAVQQVTFLGFTLDGPRGPRRAAKPGIAVLAARTKIPVVPIAFAAQPAWRLRSWDRFIIPKPGARVHVAFGPAIMPPPDESEGAVEAVRVEVEARLAELQLQTDSGL